MAGPLIRTDIVEVYVFACTPEREGEWSFLQIRRTRAPMAGSWQPVMGHIEQGESAVDAGLRELTEETGLSPMSDAHGRCLWQLEAVNTFFLASLDAIFMCPGLAVQVDINSPVTLDDAHDDFRWVHQGDTDRDFFWPGQRVAVRQIIHEIMNPPGKLNNALRLK